MGHIITTMIATSGRCSQVKYNNTKAQTLQEENSTGKGKRVMFSNK
jgi:hypothetical protein